MKPTKKQKLNLARSMSFEMWNELCTSGLFCTALESDIEAATILAERFAFATDRRAEMDLWKNEPGLSSILNSSNPERS